jgi:hypothetical protein
VESLRVQRGFRRETDFPENEPWWGPEGRLGSYVVETRHGADGETYIRDGSLFRENSAGKLGL